jgi:hypothetical protein
LGGSGTFGGPIADFAVSCAEHSNLEHRVLVEAIDKRQRKA